MPWNDGTSLYHYGIPGQKWGVQNGPPYPLGTKQLSSRERHKRYDKKSRKLMITDKQKRLVEIGAAVVVSGLAIYGAYKLSEISGTGFASGNYETYYRRIMRLRKEKYNVRIKTVPYIKPNNASQGVKEFAERNNINLKDYIRSVDEDIDSILADRPDWAHDDCVPLALTQILNRMGLDVYPEYTTTHVFSSNFKYYFEGYKPVSLKGLFEHNMNISDIDAVSYNATQSQIVLRKIEEMCVNSDDACGIIAVTFLGEKEGHTTPWFKENGVIRFGDIQAISIGDNSPVLGDDTVIDFRQGFKEFTLARLDNTTPTDALIYGTEEDPRPIIRLEKNDD